MSARKNTSGPAAVMSTLKVRQEDQQLIAKISGLRLVSIAKLFADAEVRNFFQEILRRELARESALLAEEPK